MHEVSDETLVKRAGGGDRLAAQLLMQRHLPKMLNLARRILRHESDAEDAVQEAFLKVWKHAGRWKPGKAKFETWLYRVVLNQCLDCTRRAKRTRNTADSQVLDTIADTAPLAEAELASAEDAARIQAALSALPERQMAALTLCHLQGLGNIEAAAVMEISVEALESLLGRGRRALRKTLAELWDEVRS